MSTALASQARAAGYGDLAAPARRPHQSQLAPADNKFHVGNGEDQKHYWLTPDWLWRDLRAEFGDQLYDPCPYPKPADYDGLAADWGPVSYVNPPFGSVLKFASDDCAHETATPKSRTCIHCGLVAADDDQGHPRREIRHSESRRCEVGRHRGRHDRQRDRQAYRNVRPAGSRTLLQHTPQRLPRSTRTNAGGMSMPIDQAWLKQFCSRDPGRYYLMKPFSQDGYTWATNGHIMVRVAEIDGVAPFEGKAINVDRPLKGIEDAKFSARSFTLPTAPDDQAECFECDGRGTAHECPDCECACTYCNGTGQLDREAKTSTTISGQIFQLRYARMVAGLPSVEVAERTAEGVAPLFFRFNGGVGALMPLSCKSPDHVEIEVTPHLRTEPASPLNQEADRG